MAKRSRRTTHRTIDRHLKEGRGQGIGSTYKPWLTVQDVPSQGLTHRIKGWTTGRIHHLFSNLERDVFYILDWSKQICDIREQYPLLPLDETKAIADEIGVKHPTDPHTQHAIVMTSDFVVDVQDSAHIIQQARTVKPAEQLNNVRVLEKLEIERCYWQTREIDWGIVTENEIPVIQSANIRVLHGYRQLEDRLAEDINGNEVIQFLLDSQTPSCIEELTTYCDENMCLPKGTALTVVYHLLASGQMTCNLVETLTGQTLLSVPEGELS